MRKGLKVQIGNGMRTSIEHQVWVRDHVVCKRQHAAGWLQTDAKVSNLMTSDRRWNAGIIWRSFSASDAEAILAIHIPSVDTEDRFCCRKQRTERMHSSLATGS